jgi:hypothetical protein
MSTRITISADNYWKPTPKRIRKFGDSMLVVLPLLQGAVMNSPLTETGKAWAVFGVAVLVVMAKFITNLFAEEPELNEDVK